MPLHVLMLIWEVCHAVSFYVLMHAHASGKCGGNMRLLKTGILDGTFWLIGLMACVQTSTCPGNPSGLTVDADAPAEEVFAQQGCVDGH